jgi:SLT domain-containing protein
MRSVLPALLAIGSAASAAAAPCDIFAAAGTPCVGAFSLLRSLFNAYDGPLYQLLFNPFVP